MFNLNKNKNDEPFIEQRRELEEFIKKYSLKIQLHDETDLVKNSSGCFGTSITNPIPVNGPIGEIKYLSRLVCSCDTVLLFHRLGCIWESRYQRVINVYESVCLGGQHWDLFYFDFNYPRRSSILPEGYKCRRYGKPVLLGPIINGVNTFVKPFPLLLTNHVRPSLKLNVLLDPHKSYEETINNEKCQTYATIEMRKTRDNEVVRKALNGLARQLFAEQNKYSRPTEFATQLKNIMELISGQIVDTNETNVILDYPD